MLQLQRLSRPTMAWRFVLARRIRESLLTALVSEKRKIVLLKGNLFLLILRRIKASNAKFKMKILLTPITIPVILKRKTARIPKPDRLLAKRPSPIRRPAPFLVTPPETRRLAT